MRTHGKDLAAPRVGSSPGRLRGLWGVALFALVASCGGGPSTPPPPQQAVHFTPQSSPPPASSVALVAPAQGTTSITLNVVATDLNNVAGVFFDVVWNPTILSFRSATLGSFLGSGGGQVTFAVPADLTAVNSSGRLPVGLALTPATAGVGGSGTLCTLIFDAKLAGGGGMSFEAAGATTPFPVTPIPDVAFIGGTVSVTR